MTKQGYKRTKRVLLLAVVVLALGASGAQAGGHHRPKRPHTIYYEAASPEYVVLHTETSDSLAIAIARCPRGLPVNGGWYSSAAAPLTDATVQANYAFGNKWVVIIEGHQTGTTQEFKAAVTCRVTVWR